MRKRNLLIAVLMAMLAALGITACRGDGGNGGGHADTMTLTVDGNDSTYTEGAINGYGYYDPNMTAGIYQNSGRTIIMMSSGVTGGGTPPATSINIVTSGHTAGAYPVDGDGTIIPGVYDTYILYSDNDQNHRSIISSGTVTIDSIGNVHEPAIGSFSAVVLCTSPSHTHSISGTFNVRREY